MSVTMNYFLGISFFLLVVGAIASYAIWLGLLKRRIDINWLRKTGWVALVSFVVSAVAGVYYRVNYYTEELRNTILEGSYPWAHSIGMTIVQGVMLVLPVLGVIVSLMLSSLDVVDEDRIEQKKKNLLWLDVLMFFLSVVALLSIVLILGAVRP